MTQYRQPRKQSIDLGLAVLDVVRPAGLPIPRKVIAEVCGCSAARIWQIEDKAIKKIKQNLGDLSDFLAEDVIERHAQSISHQLEGLIS